MDGKIEKRERERDRERDSARENNWDNLLGINKIKKVHRRR